MRSPVARLAMLSFVLAGCTSTSVPQHTVYSGIYVENLPKHRVYDLNWIERTPLGLATFRVKRLEVGPHGWNATVSFTNESRQGIKLPTGGTQSPRSFGLGVFTDQLTQRVEDPGNYLISAHVDHALPKILRPGETWSGTFSSPHPPRSRRVLRVIFGTFFWQGKPPGGILPYFAWVTTHFVHAPGPQGLPATTTGS